MTAYMPYQLRTDEQEAEAKILGSSDLAVRQADPRLTQLERGAAGRKMDRQIMLGKLGMEKKSQEHNLKMAEGNLRLGAERLKLQGRANKFDMRMTQKANVVAKWGVAMNLAFGATGFIERMKQSRMQQEQFDMQMLMMQENIAHMKKLREEQK